MEQQQAMLWSTHSVLEMRDLEQRTRQQAEDKKEELRQLVGFRYRDLLDSADSIMHMRDVCRRVLTRWTHVTHTLDVLTSPTSSPPTTADSSSSDANATDATLHRSPSTSLQVEAKLTLHRLAQAPERVWCLLADHRYLDATLELVRAGELVKMLQQQQGEHVLDDDDGDDDDDVGLRAFAEHQKRTLRHFPDTLERAFEARLLTVDGVAVTEYACVLAAMLRLAEFTGRAVCGVELAGVGEVEQLRRLVDFFLDTRTRWAATQLQVGADLLGNVEEKARDEEEDEQQSDDDDESKMTEDAVEETDATATRRDQLLQRVRVAVVSRTTQAVVSTVVSTVLHCACMFSSSTLVSGLDVEGSPDAARLHDLLGVDVLPSEELVPKVSAWLAQVAANSKPVLQSSVFVHLSSGKQLQRLRDQVFEQELWVDRKLIFAVPWASTDEGEAEEEEEEDGGEEEAAREKEQQEGDEPPVDPLRQHLLWRECWLHSCSAAVGERVDVWSLLCLEPFAARCLQVVDAAFASVPIADMVDALRIEKATAEVDPVEHTRSTLHERIAELLSDLETLLTLPMATDAEAPYGETLRHEPDSLALRAFIIDRLLPYIQRSCTSMVSLLLTHLEEIVSDSQSRLLEMDASSPEAADIIEQTLVVARLARVLADEKTLRRGLSLHTHVDLGTDAQPASSASPVKGGRTYEYIRSSLMAVSATGFRIWTRFVGDKLGDTYASDLRAWLHASAVDDVECGHPVPTQCSPYAMKALFSLTRELCSAHGTDLDADTLRHLNRDAAEALLDILATHVDANYTSGEDVPSGVEPAASEALLALSRRAAVALYFDVFFVLLVLDHRLAFPSADGDVAPKLRERASAVQHLIRAHIGDDLDQAQLERSAYRLLSRVMVMFGSLTHLHRPQDLPAVRAVLQPSASDDPANSTSTTLDPSDGPSLSNIVTLAEAGSTLKTYPMGLYPHRHG